MNLLTVENISKLYTARTLFDQACFSLQEHEKVGIIGINGTGKSTLLRIIAGLEEPDSGQVIRGNHVVIHYLPQMPEFDPNKGLLDNVIERAQGNASDGVWDIETEAKSMLTRLGVTNFEEPVAHLSGGQKKRMALVSALVTPCDILILDEPTNHLDSEMSEWLEGYLKSFKGSILMVTHDRYFLDSVCNRIVEVDKGQLYNYETNYSGFLALKQERMEYAEAAERKRQSILRKEIEWMSRGARARSTKQKAHIQRYENLRDQKGPEYDREVAISSISTRMGRTTVELEHITKAYGDRTLIRDFSYIFLKGDRVGFVGSNGCGKTTLMKLIDGRIAPDSGKITIGSTIRIGYYTQEIETDVSAGIAYMDPEMKVIDYIKNTAEYVRTNDGLISASSMLDSFLFPPKEQYSPIKNLSGGETRRLNLLRVLMEAPNVLILDEPTNDLDITTLTILEDYLDNYDGIVITVSHDRYFLDRVVRRIFAFEGDGVLTQYEGGYTDYQAKKPTDDDTAASSPAAGSSGSTSDSKNTWKQREKKLKFTYQEQKDYETIEADISELEEKLAQLEHEITQNASNYSKLSELTNEKEALEEQILEKMDRWEYLEDLAQKIKEGGNGS